LFVLLRCVWLNTVPIWRRRRLEMANRRYLTGKRAYRAVRRLRQQALCRSFDAKDVSGIVDALGRGLDAADEAERVRRLKEGRRVVVVIPPAPGRPRLLASVEPDRPAQRRSTRGDWLAWTAIRKPARSTVPRRLDRRLACPRPRARAVVRTSSRGGNSGSTDPALGDEPEPPPRRRHEEQLGGPFSPPLRRTRGVADGPPYIR
jgi:hypothetical protein